MISRSASARLSQSGSEVLPGDGGGPRTAPPGL